VGAAGTVAASAGTDRRRTGNREGFGEDRHRRQVHKPQAAGSGAGRGAAGLAWHKAEGPKQQRAASSSSSDFCATLQAHSQAPIGQSLVCCGPSVSIGACSVAASRLFFSEFPVPAAPSVMMYLAVFLLAALATCSAMRTRTVRMSTSESPRAPAWSVQGLVKTTTKAAVAVGGVLLLGGRKSVNAAEEVGISLSPLPYAYDALEPFIGKKTLEIHHDKHHAKVR